MGSVIKLTESQWERLQQRLREDYRSEPSVMLIRTKMRRALGFTVRHHREWIDPRVNLPEPDQLAPTSRGWLRESVCLDFFDDALETWFRLKYSEYIS